MGIFTRLFSRKPRTPSASEQVSDIIERFTRATIQGVDPEDIGRYPAKQHQVMAFHFGAIDHLCHEYGLDETEKLGVFVAFIDKYFNLPVSETGSISERLYGFRTNPDERRFFEAGVDVFQRWHEHDERRAPLELGRMLNTS